MVRTDLLFLMEDMVAEIVVDQAKNRQTKDHFLVMVELK